MLLSTAYLGNIQYYTKLISGEAVIYLHENYQKQSFRNRCDITIPTGSMSLTVPVYQPHNMKVKSCDIRIDHSKKWQHQHLQAIISSYRCSPYFEHYEGELAPFFYKRYEFLTDMNREMQDKILHLMGVTAPIKYTDHYISQACSGGETQNGAGSEAENSAGGETKKGADDEGSKCAGDETKNSSGDETESGSTEIEPRPEIDFRMSLSPKIRLQKEDLSFSADPYYQVFNDRTSFIPNLSIIDLLFSEGPQSIVVLEKSIR